MANEDKEMENYQMIQQQLQLIMLQRQQMKLQDEELDHALQEVEKASGNMYRLVGPILLEAKKDEVVRDLQEKKGSVGSRLELLTKQEERLKKNLADLRKTLERTDRK